MKFDSTHERNEKMEFHRNTLSCMTILFLSLLRCCAKRTALKYTLHVCLAKVAVTDTERYILSTSPYIWGSRCHYCITLSGISRRGREKGEKNGCCLFFNSGITMTSQGTGIAKYSDYKWNETIFSMFSLLSDDCQDEYCHCHISSSVSC